MRILVTTITLFISLITMNVNALSDDEKYFTCVKIAETLYGKNSNGNSIPSKSKNKHSIRCSIQAVKKAETKHYMIYTRATFNLKDGSYDLEDSREEPLTEEKFFNHWAEDKNKNKEFWDIELAKVKIPPINKDKIIAFNGRNNLKQSSGNEELNLCKLVGDKEDNKTANRLIKISEAKRIGNMIYCLYKFDESGFLKYAEAEVFPKNGSYKFKWLR